MVEEGHIVEGPVSGTILDNIDTITPDVIILDDLLGKEKGSDLCIKLKSDPLNSSIPIILFTAQTYGEELAERVNADGFLNKPFDIDQLLAMIDNLL